MKKIIFIFLCLYLNAVLNVFSQQTQSPCVSLQSEFLLCKERTYNIPLVFNSNAQMNCNISESITLDSTQTSKMVLVLNNVSDNTVFSINAKAVSNGIMTIKIPANVPSNVYQAKLTYIAAGIAPNGSIRGVAYILSSDFTINVFDNLSNYPNGANFNLSGMNDNYNYNSRSVCRNNSGIVISPNYNFYKSEYIVRMPLGTVCNNNIQSYTVSTDQNYIYFHFSEYLLDFIFNLSACELGSYSLQLTVKNSCGEVSSNQSINVYGPLDQSILQITTNERVCLNKKDLHKFEIVTIGSVYADEYYWYFSPNPAANCVFNNPTTFYNNVVYTTNQPFLETNLEELAQQIMGSSVFAGSYKLVVYAKGINNMCDNSGNNLAITNLGNGRYAHRIGETSGVFTIPPRINLFLNKNVTCSTEKNGSLSFNFIANSYSSNYLSFIPFQEINTIGNYLMYELYNVNDDTTPIRTGTYQEVQNQGTSLITGLPAGEYYIKLGFTEIFIHKYYYTRYWCYFNNDFYKLPDFCKLTGNSKLNCCFYQSNTIKIIDGSPFFDVLCTSSTGCGTNQRGVVKVKASFPGYNGNLPNGATFAGFVYRLRDAQSGQIVNEGHVAQVAGTGERNFDIVSNAITSETTYNLEVSAALSTPNTNNQVGCYNCFIPYCKSDFDINFKSTKFEVNFLQSAWQDNTDTYFKCTNSGNFQVPISLFAQTNNNCNSDLFRGYRIRILEANSNTSVFDITYATTTFMIASSLNIPIQLPGRYILQFSGTGTYSNCLVEKPFVIIEPQVSVRTSYKDITCVGNLGEASIYANGGIGNLGYRWEKLSGVAPLGVLPFTGSSVNGLTAGTYKYYISMPELSNSSNYLICDYIATGTFTIGNTMPLVTGVVFSGAGGTSCLAGASINLSVPQYTNYVGQFYSVEWSKSSTANGTFSPLFSEMVQQTNASFFNHSISQSLFVSNDWYKIKVTDPNGCVFESVASKLTKPTQTRTYEICIRWESYDLTPKEPEIPVDLSINPQEMIASLQNQADACLRTRVNAFALDLAKCNNLDYIKDTLTIEYQQKSEHYMLYYYDRAGRLTKTVPPAGVNPLNGTEEDMRMKETKHTMATTYEYNSLGQVISQHSPDGGRTYFVHDKLGRIRFSEDAQQRLDNTYSYKKYDELGRVYEVGKQQKGATSVSNYTGTYTTEIGEQFNQFINLDALVGGCMNAPLPRTYQINPTQIPNWLSAKLDDSSPNITTNADNTTLLLPDRGDATTFSFTSQRNGNADFVLQLTNANTTTFSFSVLMFNKTDNQLVYSGNFSNNIVTWNTNLIQNKSYKVKVTALSSNIAVDFLKATIYPAVIINNNTNEPNRVSVINYNAASIVWAAITPPQNTTVASYSVVLKRGSIGNIMVSSAIVNINPNNLYSYVFSNLLQNTTYRAEIRANYSNNTQSPTNTLLFTTSSISLINLEAENNTENTENSTLRLSGYPNCGQIGAYNFNISINGGVCNYPISIAVNNKTTDPVFVGTIEQRRKNDEIGRGFPCVGGSSEETITVYTTPADNLTYQGKPQTNLLNRVSYAYTNNKYSAGNDGNRVYNYYSYDTHGHVEWLAIDIPGLPRKFVAYDYDLLSGKVHKVKYNEGQPDQFFHRYEYDADNRLLEVYTSTNNVTWDKDAKYKYYAHGPLQRVELGQNKIQGLDYVYTIQGWLKGINSPQAHIAPKPYLDQEPNATNYTDNITPQYEQEDIQPRYIMDVGKDGDDSNQNNANKDFAPDQFGMALSYFNGDYISGRDGNYSSFSYNGDMLKEYSPAMAPIRQLYNGNISAWTTHTNRREATTNQYTYDRLHRIKTSTFYKSTANGGLSFNHLATNYHQTSYSYDANGNIQRLQRSDNLGNAMDNFTYNYSAITVGSLNKLENVIDNVSGNDSYKKDLKGTKIYQYDAIGNIISQQNNQGNGITDNSTIEWNAYGKVARVTRNRSDNVPDKNTEIIYLYDPMGNRVAKRMQNIENGKTKKTFYARDAQGNVLSIYENGKEKTYRDAQGNTYYFNAQSELIKIIDANNVEQNISNITGKLIVKDGRPALCINNIQVTSCQNKLEIQKVDENIYADEYNNKYHFNAQNQLIQVEYGGIQQVITIASGQTLIIEKDRFYICLDNPTPCKNKLQIQKVDGNIYSDQYGNLYYFNTQNQLINVVNQGSQQFILEVVGQPLIIETGLGSSSSMDISQVGVMKAVIGQITFYICIDKPIPCKNKLQIKKIDENIYQDQYGNEYHFNAQNQLIQIKYGGIQQVITIVSGQLLIIENGKFFICLDNSITCQNKLQIKKIDENIYRDSYGNLYYFNEQNQLVQYENNSGGTPLISTINGQPLIIEGGKFFICLDNEDKCDKIILLDELTNENTITQTEVPIYGSDRIGTYNPQNETEINSDIYILNRSYKRYELKDHLGNVRVTVSDSKRVAFVSETLVFSADIKTYTDYYAFGMEMVGRNWSEGEAYRFGHNGQEKSKEVGEGNYTAEFWEYDSQVIRRFNTDPVVKEYESAYLAFGGNPIWFSDVNGDDAEDPGKKSKINVLVFLTDADLSKYTFISTMSESFNWNILYVNSFEEANSTLKEKYGDGYEIDNLVIRTHGGGNVLTQNKSTLTSANTPIACINDNDIGNIYNKHLETLLSKTSVNGKVLFTACNLTGSNEDGTEIYSKFVEYSAKHVNDNVTIYSNGSTTPSKCFSGSFVSFNFDVPLIADDYNPSSPYYKHGSYESWYQTKKNGNKITTSQVGPPKKAPDLVGKGKTRQMMVTSDGKIKEVPFEGREKQYKELKSKKLSK